MSNFYLLYFPLTPKGNNNKICVILILKGSILKQERFGKCSLMLNATTMMNKTMKHTA